MRNIFLEKLHTKCGGETSPKPFSNKSILRIFLNFTQFVFIVLFYCASFYSL